MLLSVLLTGMLCSVFVEASQSAWKDNNVPLVRSHSVSQMVGSALFGSPSVASNGLSFGVDTKISADRGGAYPMVATDTVGGVYVTWYNLDTLELFFTYSHNYGKSWASVTKLCGGGNPLVGYSDPDVAVDGRNGYVYVAWIDNRTGHTNVYVCGSADRGVHFGSAVMVNDVDGSDIASVDSGVSYSTHVTVANNGTVYVAWQDNRTNPSCSDVYLARSTDNGHAFEGNTRVNPYETGANHTGPWVTVDEAGVVYVVYTKTNLTAQSIFMTKSSDGGLSFKAPAKVNDDSLNCYRGKKEFAVSKDGKIYIVWTDGRNGLGNAFSWDIYFATSSDGGLSFGTNVRVNDDHGLITHGTPSLAIDREGGIHVVWEDFRNRVESSSYFRDIYYAFLNDSHPFSENVRVNYLPNATRVDCADPNIAIDSYDNLYIIWADSPYSDNNYGIYLALPETTPISPSIIHDVLTWAALSAGLVLVVTAIILMRKRRGGRRRQPPSDETHPLPEESLGSTRMRTGHAQNGLPASESSSAQGTNEGEYSIFQHFYKLVVSPSEAMKDIGLSPDYGGPVLLVILNTILGVAAVLLVLQKI